MPSHLHVDQLSNLRKPAWVRGTWPCCPAGLRSKKTGLLGNTLDVDKLEWVRFDASIGAGTDSFYEYLLKVSLLSSQSMSDRLVLLPSVSPCMFVSSTASVRLATAGSACRQWSARVQ